MYGASRGRMVVGTRSQSLYAGAHHNTAVRHHIVNTREIYGYCGRDNNRHEAGRHTTHASAVENVTGGGGDVQQRTPVPAPPPETEYI